MKKIILFLSLTLFSINVNAQRIFTSPVAGAALAINGYNVKDYGLKGDGVTDDRAALNTLLNTTAPSGSTIYFPPGTYLVNSNTNVSGKQFNFIGCGSSTIIKTISPIQILTFSSTSAKCKLLNLSFLGSASTTNQYGIYFTGGSSGNFVIDNCSFTGFSGGGVAIESTNASSALGGLITNSKFITNNIGVDCFTSGEYVQILGCDFKGNTYGVQSTSGNLIIDGCNANYNTNAFRFITGGNNGHAIISNNNINHNSALAIDFSGINYGMTVSDNHIYEGSISIVTCTGITISGGIIDVIGYTFTNNTGCIFKNVSFDVGYANTISLTGTTPLYINCHNLSGNQAIDADNFTTVPPTKYTLTGSATLDFLSTAAQSHSDLTITITGAAIGDPVDVGIGSLLDGTNYFAYVSALNTVSVRLNNYSATAKDPASATFKVTVFKN